MAKAFMRLIRSPQRKLGVANLRSIAQKEIRTAMNDKIKPKLLNEFKDVVYEWESDVQFAARTYIRKDSITVYVFPTGKDKDVWIYVDQGTKPHTITPKKPGGILAFPWGGYGSYVPKTVARPARVVRGGGYVRSPKMRFFPSVQHPGSEGRGFTEQIANEFLPDFRREIENAFRRAARKAGG